MYNPNTILSRRMFQLGRVKELESHNLCSEACILIYAQCAGKSFVFIRTNDTDVSIPAVIALTQTPRLSSNTQLISHYRHMNIKYLYSGILTSVSLVLINTKFFPVPVYHQNQTLISLMSDSDGKQA